MVAANWPFEKRWPFVAQAVRVGNYYAEDQEEVLRYIAEVHRHQTDSTCWILDFFTSILRESLMIFAARNLHSI
jgi:hypothetical protein